MDTILQNAQRQGRISFYMTCRGEEVRKYVALLYMNVYKICMVVLDDILTLRMILF